MNPMNTRSNKVISDSELHELLQLNEPLSAPQHFTQKVMASINTMPQIIKNQPTWWQWLALTLGGIPAIIQTLALMFSAWQVASIA